MANDINAITLSCYKGKYGQINNGDINVVVSDGLIGIF